MPKFCPECRSTMNDAAPTCDSCGCNFSEVKPTHAHPYLDATLATGALLGVAGAVAGLAWALRSGWIW